MLHAIRLAPGSFAHCSPALRCDPAVCLEAVTRDGDLLFSAEGAARDDEQCVRAAVKVRSKGSRPRGMLATYAYLLACPIETVAVRAG